jgi:hypothetical protein
MSRSATFAPALAKARAVAAPKPEPAPVTRADIPFTSILVTPVFYKFEALSLR